MFSYFHIQTQYGLKVRRQTSNYLLIRSFLSFILTWSQFVFVNDIFISEKEFSMKYLLVDIEYKIS